MKFESVYRLFFSIHVYCILKYYLQNVWLQRVDNECPQNMPWYAKSGGLFKNIGALQSKNSRKIQLCMKIIPRDHFVYMPSQLEMTLQCNVVSHWLGAYTKWSFHIFVWVRYFVQNFKGILWNSTENVLPIHWNLCISFFCNTLGALRFKSS